MVTKAISIELVSDLTTELFIGVLCRFISRSGRSQSMYGDNATSFKGANKVLEKLKILFSSGALQKNVNNFLRAENICWHFIPPDYSHLGGLREAGIKSVRHHMCRVIGNLCLSFEEVSTILT